MGKEKGKVGRKYYTVIRLHCKAIYLSHWELPARIHTVQLIILSLVLSIGWKSSATLLLPQPSIAVSHSFSLHTEIQGIGKISILLYLRNHIPTS